MTNTRDGNAPAFPRPYSEDDYGDYPKQVHAQEGLTKREYFAAMAMQGLVQNINGENVELLAKGIMGGRFYAGAAVVLADALLSALNEETK